LKPWTLIILITIPFVISLLSRLFPILKVLHCLNLHYMDIYIYIYVYAFMHTYMCIMHTLLLSYFKLSCVNVIPFYFLINF
jgi:hypothetical protein